MGTLSKMAEKQQKNTGCLLPISRIRTIMKSSPDVAHLSNDSLYLVTKATEIFVQDLSRYCLKRSKDPNKVTYNDLAEIVDNDEIYQFLQDIIPKKITAREYFEIMKNRPKDSDDDDDEDDDDDDDDDDDK